MRRSILLALIAALAAGGTVGAHYRHNPVSAEAQFRAMQRGQLSRLDGGSADGRVVFLGSSTFQGLDVSAITPYGLNLGIGGDTLRGLSERAGHYRSLNTARAVWINIGFNDLARRCELPSASITEVMALAPPEVPVLVLGIQGIDSARLKTRCDGRLPALIAELNASHERDCASRRGCTYVPHPVAALRAPSAPPPPLEADGIHLSPDGYSELITVMRAALAHVNPALAAPGSR